MNKLNKMLRTPRAELESAIARGCSLHRLQLSEYAAKVGIHPATLRRRRTCPEDLTIKEIKNIARAAEINLGEFAAKLGG